MSAKKTIHGLGGGPKFIFGNSPAAIYLSDVLIDKKLRKRVSLFFNIFNTDFNCWVEMYALAPKRIKLNKKYQDKSLLFLYSHYLTETEKLIPSCGLLIISLIRNIITAKYKLYKRVIKNNL